MKSLINNWYWVIGIAYNLWLFMKFEYGNIDGKYGEYLALTLLLGSIHTFVGLGMYAV